MVSGLSADAVRGIASQKRDALASGDIEELLRLNKSVFGGFKMMADEDDDDDNDGDNDDDTGGDDDNDSGDDDGDDDDGDADDKDAKVSKAEYDKLMRRMKAADQRASKAEKAEQERQRKEKSDLENTASDLQAEKDKNAELQSELSALKLNNSFLSANTITWHNPAAAMKLAQSEGYLDDAVGDDGSVDEKALKSALKALAKDHQYLVKKGSGDDDGGGSSGESGSGRSRNRDDKDAKEEKDARRAPSLSRRGRVTPAARR